MTIIHETHGNILGRSLIGTPEPSQDVSTARQPAPMISSAHRDETAPGVNPVGVRLDAEFAGEVTSGPMAGADFTGTDFPLLRQVGVGQVDVRARLSKDGRVIASEKYLGYVVPQGPESDESEHHTITQTVAAPTAPSSSRRSTTPSWPASLSPDRALWWRWPPSLRLLEKAAVDLVARISRHVVGTLGSLGHGSAHRPVRRRFGCSTDGAG